jgi:hypothetical protein
MRAPLEKIELVDKYLTGKLTAAEQLNFIKTLETDVELQQLMNLQKDIIKAVQRKALKAEIKITIRKVDLWKKIWKWVIGGSIVMAAGVAGLLVLDQEPETIPHKNSNVPTISTQTKKEMAILDSTAQTDERIDFNGLKTWVDPDVQTFKVNPSKGATIEGKEGTLIIVPPDAFVDEQNKVVTAVVEFRLVEALKLEDMILYNLGTTSNGKALGTGGMLNFDFTASGKKVTIDAKRPLYVEVPTSKVREGMMAFKGEVKNGKINWVDPKPLKKYLVNVDFMLLDFLPIGFEDTVGTLLPFKGHKIMSSVLTDSLYYSVDFICGSARILPKLEFRESSIVIERAPRPAPIQPAVRLEADSSRATVPKVNSCCGIDPLAIKTLKTLPFAKTFIATQEFAERVRELHKLENGNEWLKIYVTNISKDLSYADSVIATKLTGDSKRIFTTFAKQRLTNIKDAAIYQDKLNDYYTKKKQEYKQQQNNRRSSLAAESTNELNRLLVAYRNATGTVLVKNENTKGSSSLTVATGSSYSFLWAKPGWVNIDCYLNGLAYGSEEVKMKLNTVEGTTEVYQWINMVDNINPLFIKGNEAIAMFPARDKPLASQMKNTFCFAISRKNGAYQWFDKRYNPYETSLINIDLEPSSIAEIKSKLKSYHVDRDLEKRLDQAEKEIVQALKNKAEAEKRAKELYEEQAIKVKLESAAYPCEVILKPTHKKKTF